MTIAEHLTDRDLKVPPPAGLDPEALAEWKYQTYIKDYLRCVQSVDDSTNRILDYLETHHLTENTIVVYTSDQGFFLGEHGWFDKRFIYEEALRMPLLIKHPGVLPAGGTCSDLIQNIDFAPTLLELAGLPPATGMQGMSFADRIQGKDSDPWRDAIYYHYYEYPAVHMVRRHEGLRTQRYKLIHFYGEESCWELYDLQRDPNELTNIYSDPENENLVARLRSGLSRLREDYEVP